jgi:2-polyprenyl-3-methyl-5-hydroxy-6-metoxy-1,4-benzoquinol methylase
MNSQKIGYLLDCAARYFSPIHCPSCQSKNYSLLERKYLVSRLFECKGCGLYFRHPLDSVKENRDFYQSKYQQSGITTYLPAEGSDLEKIKETIVNNPDNAKNALRIKGIFEALYPAQKDLSVLDYGASWGYITWQLKLYGYKVQSYEISQPRAHYGNLHLGLDIQTDENNLKAGNQIFFSSHVIEHVPVVSDMLALAAKLTLPEGFVVTLCPNGSPEFRQKDPVGFHHVWGKVHPNYLNASFFQKYFAGKPLFISTTPFDLTALANWDKQSQHIGDLSGSELLVIACPHQSCS